MQFHPATRPAMKPAAYTDAPDDDSDTYSMRSGSTGFAPSAASSATTVDWEMRSASRPPSVFSFTSSLRANAFRHEYGRGLNNYSEVYRLPADDEELERLGESPSDPARVSAVADVRRQTACDVHGGHGQVPAAHARRARRRHPWRRAKNLRRPRVRERQLVCASGLIMSPALTHRTVRRCAPAGSSTSRATFRT